MKTKDRWHQLIAGYQTEQISDEDFAELEEGLRTSSEARELFHRASRFDSQLRREAENAMPEREMSETEASATVIPLSSGRDFRSQSFFKGIGAAAAVVLFSALTWTIAAQKRVIATLVSSENAGWESVLPTEPGSQLTKGSLRLTSGIATLRFVSGVEMTLEAPAIVFLKGSKKAKLVSGTIVVSQVKTEDFLLETDHGQAVSDNGEYIASVDRDEQRSNFEALSGKVLVSHDISREAIQLTSGAAAAMLPEKLESSETLLNEQPLEQLDQGILIGTNGRSATFIRNNKPHKWTRPEFLTLKQSNLGHGFDQRSVVAFDLSAIQSELINDATLRVNLVPSGIGLASRLPLINRFAVYGLVNPAKENWSTSDLWEDAPAPEDGILVGQFEIPRSQQTGAIDITSESFLQFVRDHAGKSASFILVRETANEEGEGRGLAHALASESHPEAAGPVLEISLKN